MAIEIVGKRCRASCRPTEKFKELGAQAGEDIASPHGEYPGLSPVVF